MLLKCQEICHFHLTISFNKLNISVQTLCLQWLLSCANVQSATLPMVVHVDFNVLLQRFWKSKTFHAKVANIRLVTCMRKIMFLHHLSIIKPLSCFNYSWISVFFAMTIISLYHICFSCCYWNLCSLGHTFIQQMDMCLYNGKNSTIYWFYTIKDIGVE